MKRLPRCAGSHDGKQLFDEILIGIGLKAIFAQKSSFGDLLIRAPMEWALQEKAARPTG
jgi:hypothetical protein